MVQLLYKNKGASKNWFYYDIPFGAHYCKIKPLSSQCIFSDESDFEVPLKKLNTKNFFKETPSEFYYIYYKGHFYKPIIICKECL